MTADFVSFVKVVDSTTQIKFAEKELAKTEAVKDDIQSHVETSSLKSIVDLEVDASLNILLSAKTVRTLSIS